ncbi:hypothetical protein KAX02_05070 [candidate division WOR-3 bacterium]|nr:hypothetical protein [candidate division WOR-3 bacterium]
MVCLIIGEINQGKTQKILSVYNRKKQGDGFITRKLFKNNTFIGYEIVRLSTEKSVPFAYMRDYAPSEWDEIYKYGPYTFSRKAFTFAENIVDEIIKKRINPIFIDEVGPLELQGKGFFRTLKEVLNTEKDIYITVRDHCVDEVIKKFNIRKYDVIKLKNSNKGEIRD